MFGTFTQQSPLLFALVSPCSAARREAPQRAAAREPERA